MNETRYERGLQKLSQNKQALLPFHFIEILFPLNSHNSFLLLSHGPAAQYT
jgi:hypothetical protein